MRSANAWRILRPLRAPLLVAFVLAFGPLLVPFWLLSLSVLALAAIAAGRRRQP
jgi:hypothetical protein